MNIRLLTFDTIDSTNTEALRQARLGADEGLCIVARQQTAGRGRQGRQWVSEPGAGLYFSMIFRPRLAPQFLPLMTLMAGVAVHDMLEELGLKPDIKWVNDVLVDEKKISGILSETAESAKGVAVVVGIGINLTRGNSPPGASFAATSVEGSGGPRLAPEEAANALIKYLTYFYSMLAADTGPADILEEWKKRSTYSADKAVRVTSGNETFTGVTDGLEANGALRIRLPDGRRISIQAGDVERLRAESVR